MRTAEEHVRKIEPGPNEEKRRMSRYEVVYPLGTPTQGQKATAPGVADLNGMTIGELSNYQFHSASTFPLIKKALLARYPDLKFVPYDAFGNIDDPNRESDIVKALPDKLREYEVDA